MTPHPPPPPPPPQHRVLNAFRTQRGIYLDQQGRSNNIGYVFGFEDPLCNISLPAPFHCACWASNQRETNGAHHCINWDCICLQGWVIALRVALCCLLSCAGQQITHLQQQLLLWNNGARNCINWDSICLHGSRLDCCPTDLPLTACSVLLVSRSGTYTWTDMSGKRIKDAGNCIQWVQALLPPSLGLNIQRNGAGLVSTVLHSPNQWQLHTAGLAVSSFTHPLIQPFNHSVPLIHEHDGLLALLLCTSQCDSLYC